MRIVDNKGIQAKRSESSAIQHGVGEKISLSKKANNQTPAKAFKRTVNHSNEMGRNSVRTGNAAVSNPNLQKNLKLSARKKYTVLNNNATAPLNHLQKRTSSGLKKAVATRKPLNLRKLKLMPKSKSRNLKIRGKSTKVSAASVGISQLDAVKNATSTVGKAFTKPVAIAGNKLLSQRANFSKTEDTGTEAIKLGAQTADYARRGARGIKTAVTAPRKIYKNVQRTVNAGKRTIKTARTTAKTTAKAAKTAARAARTTARATVQATKFVAKAAVQTVKAVSQAVAKLVSLIAETMPWSLIVILIIAVIILVMVLVSNVISNVTGGVTGAGGWAISDSEPNTPEQIYQNLEKFLDEAEKSLENKAQKPLKNKVKSFCDGDTAKPRRIIEYQSNTQNVVLYPAQGKDSIIGGYIDNFDLEFYPDFLATLFVLMTRDKQIAEGTPDTEIYDFDFKRSDFDEFIGGINQNTCKYGQTYVYKTTQEVPNCFCPGQNCERKTIPGCKCASYTDEDGKVYYYCGGHPYCPQNHTKLVVRLYTIQEYTKMELADIYSFTDNEQARFEATKSFIQALIEDYGGDN